MNAQDILGDPAWFPHHLTPERGGTIKFAHLPRARHRTVTFLDDQYLGDYGRAELSFDEVAGQPSSPAPHFIFHSAFCCSTLLIRAFDLDRVAMGLKEPAILNELAAIQRAGQRPVALSAILDLLARPFTPGEAVIVKPSNLANDLMPLILAARPDSRAILLYAPLRAFLRSVAKKGLGGRIWMRRLYATLHDRSAFNPGYPPEELFKQTDLQIAALAWLQQQAVFARLLTRFPDRLKTLNSEEFLAERQRTIARASRHFGIGLAEAQVETISAGPVFEQHSKKLGTDYHVGVRSREAEAVDAAHGDEIDLVLQWAEILMKQFSVPEVLPRRLLA